MRSSIHLIVAACCWLIGCGGDDDGTSHADAAAAADAAGADAGPPLVRLTVLDGAVATNATWVAYQDGDGPWTVIEGIDGEYAFIVEDERYAVAVVCIQERDDHPIAVWRATRSELPALRLPCDRFDDFGFRISGEIDGLETGDDYTASASRFTTSGWSFPDTTYDVGTDAGLTDLVVKRTNGAAVDFVSAHGIDVSDDMTLDVDLADSYAAVPGAITVTGVQSEDDLRVGAQYLTQHGTRMGLTAVPSGWFAVPAQRLMTGDIEVVSAEEDDYPLGPERAHFQFRRQSGDVALALPEPLDEPSVMRIDEPPEEVGWRRVARLRVSIVRQPAVQLYAVAISDSEPDGNLWTDFATSGWLDASGADVIETPDLSHLEGWNTDFSDGWGIDSGDGDPVSDLTGYGANRGVSAIVDAIGVLQGMAPAGDEDGLDLRASAI